MWTGFISFEQAKASKIIDIPSWDKFLSFYIDPHFDNQSFYDEYKDQVYKISYDMQIIMEIKTSLVLMAKTSSPDHYSLLTGTGANFDNSLKKGIKKISGTIFEDTSQTLILYDSLVDDIITSMPSSDWDQLLVYKRMPKLPSSSLARAYITMFGVFYCDFGKHLTNSAILKTLSNISN